MKTKHLPIVSALFLMIAMTIQFLVSYHWEKSRVQEHVDYEMQLAQKDFLFEIFDIQDAGEEMKHFLNHILARDPEQQRQLIQRQTRITLRRYPDVMACYVSFPPGYYQESDYWYCPCAWWKNDSIVEELYGDEKHDYFQSAWYKGALREENGAYWSPAYRDEDFDVPICTHSVRVEKDGKLACVVGLDFSMEWVNKMLEDIKPFDDAICRLYSSEGTLILTSAQPEMESRERHEDNWIIRSEMLSPVDMRLEIAVPKSHVWKSVRTKSLITLAVLLFGILLAGWLIHRIWNDQATLARVETENKVMEHELQIASEIQQSILRESNKRKVKGEIWDDVELEAKLVPMREVGGDLYDYYRTGDDLYFIIGDVSGKSVPAAMFMSATVNLFRSAVLRLQSPKAIMEEMNNVLSDNNPRLMFVTAFIGRLHIPTGELLYCNAGHLPPIKVRRDEGQSTKEKVESLSLIPNIPMGYEGSFRYEEQGVMLHEGDSLVLYTDGITEARNEKREMLGVARWREMIGRQKGSFRCYDLQEEVKAFMVNTEPTDDITLMVIRKLKSVEPRVMRVENKIEQWPALRQTLHAYGLCAGMDKRTLKKIEVAIEEAVVNIVNYSQAEWMEVEVSRQKSAIRIQLSDNGVAFDPTAQTPADIEKAVEERQIGGLGIALVKQIADELHYRRGDNTNQLVIIKNI